MWRTHRVRSVVMVIPTKRQKKNIPATIVTNCDDDKLNLPSPESTLGVPEDLPVHNFYVTQAILKSLVP